MTIFWLVILEYIKHKSILFFKYINLNWADYFTYKLSIYQLIDLSAHLYNFIIYDNTSLIYIIFTIYWKYILNTADWVKSSQTALVLSCGHY